MSAPFRWSGARDEQLQRLVQAHMYDFAAAAMQLGITAEECRERFAFLDRGEVDQEEAKQEAKAVLWTEEQDNLLMVTVKKEMYDFNRVALAMGVSSAECRARFAFLDKLCNAAQDALIQESEDHSSSEGSSESNDESDGEKVDSLDTKTRENDATKDDDEHTAPAAPEAPSFAQNVVLQLPSDEFLSGMPRRAEPGSAKAFNCQELQHVFDILDSAKEQQQPKNPASFEELFGISESELDVGKPVGLSAGEGQAPVEVANDTLGSSYVEKSHLDLTNFTETFDRVAKALGCDTEGKETA